MSSNGKGNGHDKAPNKDDANKVVKFPTLADRDRIRKEKIEKEESWRREYKAKQKAMNAAANAPFLNVGNIPLFVKIMMPLLIIIHAVIHLPLSELQIMQIYQLFGVLPTHFGAEFTPLALMTPFTHIFIHGGWMHLVFNGVMLTALGTFFAREFGDKVALVLFILSGLGGAALFLALNWGGTFPLIGASGAVSGFFGVFLIMIQKRGGFNQFGAVQKYGSLPIIAFWLAFMIITTLIFGGHSWEAHIGGFLTGIMWLSWLLHGHLKFWKL